MTGDVGDAVVPVPPIGDGRGGGIARGEDQRIVDATARISLGADADEVQDVANGVVEVTDRYDGVVLTSAGDLATRPAPAPRSSSRSPTSSSTRRSPTSPGSPT